MTQMPRPKDGDLQRADGSEFRAEVTATRVPIEGQRLFTAFVRDITAEQRAEQTMRESHEMLEHNGTAGASKIQSTPGSLPEVLLALEADHEFLLRGGVFTNDVIEEWISYKREHEVDPVALRPHPYEFHLYYDI